MTVITLKVVSAGNKTSHSQIGLILYKNQAALQLLPMNFIIYSKIKKIKIYNKNHHLIFQTL